MSVAFCVFLKVKPAFEADFLETSRLNQAGARQEPGNLKFDIYRSMDNSSDFLFVEAYDSEESIDAHRKTPHFAKWLETATPMLAEPRRLVPGNDVPSRYERI